MNVSQLTPIVKAMYNAQRTAMIWGAPGIGKSMSFLAAAQEIAEEQIGKDAVVIQRHQVKEYRAKGGDMRKAFGLFDLRLSQMDPVEVGGLPREDETNGTMAKLPPSWFAHTQRDDLPDFGILLLEELPTAPLSVQTTAYQITLDGVIDDFRLKDGWTCFAAGNRMSDGGSYTKMPNALANRMAHIDVESDLESWVSWAIGAGIEHSLISFIRFRSDLLNTYEEHVTKKLKGFAFATERQWHAVNDFIVGNSVNGQLTVDAVTSQAIMAGLVGAGPAAEYEGFRQVWHKMPNIDGIILSPDTAVIPDDSATQFAVMTALANKADYNNLQNCFVYAERFVGIGRDEFMMLFVRDMQRKQSLAQAAAIKAGDNSFRDATMSPAFSQWASKYASLF
jgi:hypothetical protein